MRKNILLYLVIIGLILILSPEQSEARRRWWPPWWWSTTTTTISVTTTTTISATTTVNPGTTTTVNPTTTTTVSLTTTTIPPGNPTMGNYECNPVFCSNDIEPNVLFMIDSSGSMHCTAYPDSLGDDQYDSHIDENYASGTNYYGYFDNSSQYVYQNNRFEEDASGEWNGNFLNWMTTRRVDVAKKVLSGGRYGSCDTGQCLKGEDQDDYSGSGTSYCEDFRKKYNNPYSSNLSPDCGTSTCYYGIKNGKIYFDDDSSPYSGYIGSYNIYVLQDSEPTGLIQTIGDKARLGTGYFHPSSSSGRIDELIKAAGTNTTDVINSIREYEAAGSTPLCRTLYTAVGYYQQIDPSGTGYIDNSAYTPTVGADGDPYYYNDLGRYVECGKSFVIMITDGQPTSDGGAPDVTDRDEDDVEPGEEYKVFEGNELDDLALWAHKETQDLRDDDDFADLPGNQNLDVYVVFAFGSGGDLMKTTAMNGGFTDIDDDEYPDGDFTAGNDDTDYEFDADDDGVPDNYFEAQEGYMLETQLFVALTEILKRSASGTAVSVLSTSSEGEGSLFQAFFRPSVYDGFREIAWVGYLNQLWVDPYGNLREDSNHDYAMVYGEDNIIKFQVDEETGDTEVVRFLDVTGPEGEPDGLADSTIPYETVPLEELEPIWEAGRILAMRDASDRTIKTWVDINGNGEYDDTPVDEFISFDTSNAAILRPFLNAADIVEAENIINFIRGEEFQGCRDRNINIGGTDYVWKLGDIVYSTPTVVGKPMERYNEYYSDYTYGQFLTDATYTGKPWEVKLWKKRGVTVYVGANDGMLHAFKAGTFHEGDNPATGEEEHGWYSTDEYPPTTTEALGDERWAYIPYNLLPHLKWLTDPGYVHVFYVDLKPKVTDVRIFPDDDTHPNGWGTILIGGMRLGGGEISLTDDFGGPLGVETRTFRSAYFVLDITDPTDPLFLGEVSDPNMGFTTSYPAIVRVESTPGFQDPEDDEWYAVVGSGPTACDGTSDQNGRIFTYNLDDEGLVQTIQTFESDTLDHTVENDALMATPITLDLNLNYNVDTIYIGDTYDNVTSMESKMYRISTRSNNNTAPDANPWPYKTDPATSPWLETTLFSSLSDPLTSNTYITSSAMASIDDDENIWVYFGTGKYYANADQTDTATQYFFGLKDACAYGDCAAADEVLFTNLYESDDIVVLTDKTVIVGATTKSWEDFITEVQLEDGWYLTMGTSGERVLNRPSVLGGVLLFPSFIPDTDVCSYGGMGKFYALYYETGTAFYNSVIGTEVYGDGFKCLESMDLGQGMTSDVGLHVGKKAQASGYIQQSTGAIEQVEVAPAFGIKSGIIGWMQY